MGCCCSSNAKKAQLKEFDSFVKQVRDSQKKGFTDMTESRAVIFYYYDIMNRYEKTLDPLFLEAFSALEDNYNRLIETRCATLCTQHPRQPVNLENYVLRQQIPTFGFATQAQPSGASNHLEMTSSTSSNNYNNGTLRKK